MPLYTRTESTPLAIGDVAIELWTPPAGFTVEECFHPSLVPFFHVVPADTLVNSTWDGTVWVPPPEPAP